jgi:hypothetical protein
MIGRSNRVTGIHRTLSAADENLIDRAIANSADSRDEVIRQLWCCGRDAALSFIHSLLTSCMIIAGRTAS